MTPTQIQYEPNRKQHQPLGGPVMQSAMQTVLAWLTEQKKCFALPAIQKACHLPATIAEHSLFGLIMQGQLKSFTGLFNNNGGHRFLFFGLPECIEELREIEQKRMRASGRKTDQSKNK